MPMPSSRLLALAPAAALALGYLALSPDPASPPAVVHDVVVVPRQLGGTTEPHPDPAWVAAAPPPPPPPPGRLFVEVTDYVEGFSAWKFTLAQILRVVEAIPGAVLVEPCMEHGRLKKCNGDDWLLAEAGSPEAGSDVEGHSPVPAGEIFDLSWAAEPGADGRSPLIVSRHDYLAHVQQFEGETVHFDVCLKMASNFHSVPRGCISTYRKELTPEMWESVHNPDEITAISAGSAWLDEGAKVLQMLFGVTSANLDGIPLRNLQFQPSLVRTVKDVLASANIGEDFSVVHWRGERPKMNFVKCAEALVEVKRKVAPPDHPVVLMTPVTADLNRWDGKSLEKYYKNMVSTPGDALALLEEHGYIKFDEVLKEANHTVRDEGMLVIYDLILATESRSFATCAHECKRGACRMCNHLGKFSDLAAELREEMAPEGGETHRCWLPNADKLFRRPTKAERAAWEAQRLAKAS